MIAKITLLFILLITLSTIFIAYSFYEGPFSHKFCDLYKESWEPHANLIRKLNRYDLCGYPEDDVFDKYIYWNGEIIAGLINETLVFKGTDSLADVEKDLTPASGYFKGGMVYSGILDIYKTLKPELDTIYSKNVTGWSLGAVLAVMYSFDHSENVDEVIVFGQPPLFDKKFVDEYDSILGNRTRSYLHRFDLIAQPFSLFNGFLKSDEFDMYRAGTATYINSGDLFNVFRHGIGYYHMSYLE